MHNDFLLTTFASPAPSLSQRKTLESNVAFIKRNYWCKVIFYQLCTLWWIKFEISVKRNWRWHSPHVNISQPVIVPGEPLSLPVVRPGSPKLHEQVVQPQHPLPPPLPPGFFSENGPFSSTVLTIFTSSAVAATANKNNTYTFKKTYRLSSTDL